MTEGFKFCDFCPNTYYCWDGGCLMAWVEKNKIDAKRRAIKELYRLHLRKK